MNTFSKIFLGIALLLVLQGAFAYEAKLSDFGFSGISLDKQSSVECKEVALNLSSEQAMQAAIDNIAGPGILSLDVNFSDYAGDSSYVTVSINGGTEQVLWPEDFKCKETCWARIFIPTFHSSETKVNLCAVLGGASKKIEISSSSLIGTYNSPALSIKNSAPAIVYLGDRAKMTMTVENTGSKEANIFVQFVHPDTRAKISITSFDIVEGASDASTLIYPGEVKQFVYYIKPSVISSYNLPAAALFFTNVFDENEVMISNHPQMSVVKPNKVEVSLVTLNEQSPYEFKAIIKNNLQTEFVGSIILAPQTALQNPVQEVRVQPNSEKEIVFNAKDIDSGSYAFVATVRDTNNIFTSNTINLEVKKTGIPFEIIFAIIGILIGVAIFAGIYFVKVNK